MFGLFSDIIRRDQNVPSVLPFPMVNVQGIIIILVFTTFSMFPCVSVESCTSTNLLDWVVMYMSEYILMHVSVQYYGRY